jgi:hypothetical protein
MGRVNTTLTLVIFVLIFLCQTGVCGVLSFYPMQAAADGTHYPVEAHMSAWAVLGALQIVAAVWYFWPAARRVAKPVRMPEAG